MKNVIALVAFLFIGFTAQAQDAATTKPGAEARAEKMVAKMKEALKLTPDQEKAVKPIMVKHFTAMEKAKASGGANQPVDNPESRVAIRRVTERELNLVLTPEQMVKYREMNKKKQAETGK